MSKSTKGHKSPWVPLPGGSGAPRGLWKHATVLTSKSAIFVIGGESSKDGTLRQRTSSSLSVNSDVSLSSQTSSAPNQESYLAEIWFYKSRAWTPSKRANSPPGVSGSGCAVWSSKIVVFGGRTSNGLTNEMFTFSEESTTWVKTRQSGDVPTAREGHSFDILPLKLPDGATNAESYPHTMVLFGGNTGEINDSSIYVLSLDTVDMIWKKLSLGDVTIPARTYHCSAHIGSKLFIFGGIDGSGQTLNDMWVIDFSGENPVAFEIEKPSRPTAPSNPNDSTEINQSNEQANFSSNDTPSWPSARYLAAMVSVHSQGLLYMCGGKTNDDQQPDDLLWTFDPFSNTWESCPLGTSCRYGHSLTPTGHQKLAMFGGIPIDSPTGAPILEAISRDISFNSKTTRAATSSAHSSKANPIPEETDSSMQASPEYSSQKSRTRVESHESDEIAKPLATERSIEAPKQEKSNQEEEQPAASIEEDDQRDYRKDKDHEKSDEFQPASTEATAEEPKHDDSSQTEAPATTATPGSAPGSGKKKKIIKKIIKVKKKKSKTAVATEGEQTVDAGHLNAAPRTELSSSSATESTQDAKQATAEVKEGDPPVATPEQVPKEHDITYTEATISNPEKSDAAIANSTEKVGELIHDKETAAEHNSEANGVDTHGAKVEAAQLSGEQAEDIPPPLPPTEGVLDSTIQDKNSTGSGKTGSGKLPGTRIRSTRVGSSTRASVTPKLPGNSEWIDYMSFEQLRSELKQMTMFIYAVKSVIDEYHPSPATPNSPSTKRSSITTKSAPITTSAAENAAMPSNPEEVKDNKESETAVPTFPTESSPIEQGSSQSSQQIPHPEQQQKHFELLERIRILYETVPKFKDPHVVKKQQQELQQQLQQQQQQQLAARNASARTQSELPQYGFSMSSSNPNLPSMSSPKSRSHGDSAWASSGGAGAGAGAGFGDRVPHLSSIGSQSNLLSSFGISSSPSLGVGGTVHSAALTQSAIPISSSVSGKISVRVVKDFDSSSTAEKQAQLLDSLMETSIPTTGAPDNDQTRKDRSYVVKELLDTEKNYVRDLKLIIEEFQDPLTSQSILQPKQIFEVFSTIKAFVPLHEQLLDNLSQTIQKPHDEQSPGQIFLAMADYLKMYTGFCASQSGIGQKVTELQKSNPSFRKYLDAKFKDVKCRGLPLTAFLVMPIQRVCRYPLLLKQIAKSTPVNHSDFKNLHYAIFKVEKVVMAVNEGKRAIEAQIQMLEIDHSMTWERKPPNGFVFIDPTRRFVLQENVEVVHSFQSGKVEAISILLFNDILIFAKVKDESSSSSSSSGGSNSEKPSKSLLSAPKRIKKVFALAETNVGLDDGMDINSKYALQFTFADDTVVALFPSKERRTEFQTQMNESISKLISSPAAQETVQLLKAYSSE